MSHQLNGASPHLPPMSPAERELWMLSHRAPEGMLMVHQSEMVRMNGAMTGLKRVLDGLFFLLAPHKRGDKETPQETLLELVRRKKELKDAIDEIRIAASDLRGGSSEFVLEKVFQIATAVSKTK